MNTSKISKTGKRFIVVTALFSLLGGLIGGGLMTFVLMTYGGMDLSDLGSGGGDAAVEFSDVSYVNAWETAAPAVVSIVALKDLSEYYDQFSASGVPGFYSDVSTDGELEEVSSGTAFLITPDGLAVTNKHVVEDDTAEYVAVLQDGSEIDVEVLDKDSLNDIALVRLVGDDERIGELPYLEFADSDEVSVGESVMAIGNALGEYSNTATVGIISATDRQIVASGTNGGVESLVNLLQTDAAINPGNSGGPLINLNGEVVGMNTAIDTTAEGIGFAIPANDISGVVLSYQEFGRIVRPFLGVRYMMLTEGNKARFGIDAEVENGAAIVGGGENAPEDERAVLAGSSADEAGLQAGDVILTVDGKELTTEFTLSNAVAGYIVGETAILEVWRNGKSIELEVEFKERD